MFDSDGKFYKPERGSKNEPDHIMLSFCGDPKTQAAVSWRTRVENKDGYLLIREAESEVQMRFEAVHKEKETDIDISSYFTAKALGLKPGTKYIYTVGNDEFRSKEYLFTTEEENVSKFKFIVITDHQKGNPTHLPDYSFVNRLLKTAFERHPDIKFILTGGDNCDNGQNELQWNGMFSGLEGIIESVPYMMTTGNHDNRGFLSYFPEPTGKFYLEHADFFDFQFENAFPLNGPKGYETENYSFEYGNVHFTVMGINAPDKVGEWAYNDMQSSNKTWKISTYHFPIYPVMPEGQNNDGYPWLRKAVEQGRPDIMINGHEHSFARTFPTVNDELFDKPSQGVIHYIAGNAGGNIYHSNAQKIWHSAFYPQEERMGLYSIFEVDGSIMTVTAFMEDGRIVDKMVIDKNKDEILPYALAPRYDRTKMCFKGQMMEFSVRGNYAENIDGVWYAPLGAVIQVQGGKVEKLYNRLICEMYGHRAEFETGSKLVKTDKGDIELKNVPVLTEGQIYVPVDETAHIFELEWYYAERNNYINWNSPHEDKVIYKHPAADNKEE